MTTEANKDLARRWFEALNAGDVYGALQYRAPNFVDHSLPPEVPPGPEGTGELLETYLEAFPDLRITIEDVLAERDMVAVIWTARATHTGEYQCHAPTGRHVTVRGVDAWRFANGKMVEHWGHTDFLGML